MLFVEAPQSIEQTEKLQWLFRSLNLLICFTAEKRLWFRPLDQLEKLGVIKVIILSD